MFDDEMPGWWVCLSIAVFVFCCWKWLTTDNAPDPTRVQENRIRHECRLKVVDARPAGLFSAAQDAWLCPDGVTWYISSIKK